MKNGKTENLNYFYLMWDFSPYSYKDHAEEIAWKPIPANDSVHLLYEALFYFMKNSYSPNKTEH